MPRNLHCNVLGSSPNVQNLESKIFENIANVWFQKSRSRLEFLLNVSVSPRQYLVSVFRILAETQALHRSLNVQFWVYLKNVLFYANV